MPNKRRPAARKSKNALPKKQSRHRTQLRRQRRIQFFKRLLLEGHSLENAIKITKINPALSQALLLKWCLDQMFAEKSSRNFLHRLAIEHDLTSQERIEMQELQKTLQTVNEKPLEEQIAAIRAFMVRRLELMAKILRPSRAHKRQKSP